MIDNDNIISGLGSLVAEVIATNAMPTRLHRAGIEDRSSAKSEQTWCTASSRASVRPRCPTPRRWASSVSRWRMRQCYRRLMAIAGRVVGQAKRFVREVAAGIKRGMCRHDQGAIEGGRRYRR